MSSAKWSRKFFGFIDHDLIPIKPTYPAAHLDTQPCYGLVNSGNDCWNLWAGFCFFKYAFVRARHLNFLYDFSRGLDTGGRNWNPVYRHLSTTELAFANESFIEVSTLTNHRQRVVQCIDGAWMHIGGIGYNNNFNEKRAFFEEYFHEVFPPHAR